MAPTLYDQKPEPGDLIEICRGSYQHWALYVGEDYVVHLASPSEVPGAGASSMMSVLCENAYVKREGLWDVVGTDQWKINNSLDEEYEPLPVDVILREARAWVGKKRPYCVFTRNCEHFVTELRYGKPQSRQVRQAVKNTGLVAGGVLGFLVLARVVAAFLGGDKKERRNSQ